MNFLTTNKFDNIDSWLDYIDIIKNNKLDVIIQTSECIKFYKNGSIHNSKNAAIVYYTGDKSFIINGNNLFYSEIYGEIIDKKYWRKFVKLQVFL
jgi:hypothetical protein